MSTPRRKTTILGAAPPATRALAASRTFFDRSPVVVLASATDLSHPRDRTAAQTAERLGVPILLLPRPGAGATRSAVREELDRLQTNAVLTLAHGDEVGDGSQRHTPAFTPEQPMAIEPRPVFVSYQ